MIDLEPTTSNHSIFPECRQLIIQNAHWLIDIPTSVQADSKVTIANQVPLLHYQPL